MAAKQFRPMTAEDAKLEILRYPLYASPKIDGLRCTVHDGVAMSRSMKPLPNKWMQGTFAQRRGDWEGMDGELTVGDPAESDCYRKTTSFIMSDDKQGFDWTFWVFDLCNAQSWPYMQRLDALGKHMEHLSEPDRVHLLATELLARQGELDEYETRCLEAGLEGVMVRDPNGLYKQGRATARGQELLKVKRSADMEAVILGCAEQMHNTNDKVVNEHTGRSLRGSTAAGLVGKNTLGALLVRGVNGPYTKIEFAVGTGFDDATRQDLWNRRDEISGCGKIVKVGYFPLGSKDRPRHPTYLGMRSALDMDA